MATIVITTITKNEQLQKRRDDKALPVLKQVIGVKMAGDVNWVFVVYNDSTSKEDSSTNENTASTSGVLGFCLQQPSSNRSFT